MITYYVIYINHSLWNGNLLQKNWALASIRQTHALYADTLPVWPHAQEKAQNQTERIAANKGSTSAAAERNDWYKNERCAFRETQIYPVTFTETWKRKDFKASPVSMQTH